LLKKITPRLGRSGWKEAKAEPLGRKRKKRGLVEPYQAVHGVHRPEKHFGGKELPWPEKGKEGRTGAGGKRGGKKGKGTGNGETQERRYGARTTPESKSSRTSFIWVGLKRTDRLGEGTKEKPKVASDCTRPRHKQDWRPGGNTHKRGEISKEKVY